MPRQRGKALFHVVHAGFQQRDPVKDRIDIPASLGASFTRLVADFRQDLRGDTGHAGVLTGPPDIDARLLVAFGRFLLSDFAGERRQRTEVEGSVSALRTLEIFDAIMPSPTEQLHANSVLAPVITGLWLVGIGFERRDRRNCYD